MCALEHWQNCQNLEVKGGERVKFFNYHLWWTNVSKCNQEGWQEPKH
jgi:hypothetical protein